MDALPSANCPGLPFRAGLSDADAPSTAAVPLASSPDDDDVNGANLGLPPEQRHPRLSDSPLQPFPLPAAPPYTLPTPDEVPPPTLAHLVHLDFAGSLPQVPLPSPPVSRAAHNLRLPSFDLLGIAAPHPDRIPLRPQYSFSELGAGPLSKPADPLHALSPPLGRFPHLDGPSDDDDDDARPGPYISQLVPMVTPPSELGTLNWGAFVKVRTAGVGSPPSSDPDISPSLAATANASSVVPGAIVPVVVGMSDALGRPPWIDHVTQLITSDFDFQQLDSVKVLTHALPCPSLDGHLFGRLITAVHERSPSHTAWINVFHAVPGRFTLSDLPKSPPSTPGPAVGGDEYFTSKVFDSAVAVPDYQLESKLLPPSPRPVVAPGSVNVSVVERYLPPTNTVEFAEMFTTQGNSLLHDRLIELSPDNGLLLFIYPTKTGARTFMRDYLGPILDPLLRSITVVHQLSADLGMSLGKMKSVERLIEYPSLYLQVQQFCDTLSASPATLQATPEQRATYTILHAAKEEMLLSRESWSDWWIKQEKPRVRDSVTINFRKSRRELGRGGGGSDPDVTPTNLIQEVLDGVANREYEPRGDGHAGPARGVEVGVFIIKKMS